MPQLYFGMIPKSASRLHSFSCSFGSRILSSRPIEKITNSCICSLFRPKCSKLVRHSGTSFQAKAVSIVFGSMALTTVGNARKQKTSKLVCIAKERSDNQHSSDYVTTRILITGQMFANSWGEKLLNL
eukprot:5024219-Amphidinium_carterae.1